MLPQLEGGAQRSEQLTRVTGAPLATMGCCHAWGHLPGCGGKDLSWKTKAWGIDTSQVTLLLSVLMSSSGQNSSFSDNSLQCVMEVTSRLLIMPCRC